MRDGLPPQAVLEWIQQPAFTGKQLEIAGESAHLSREFLAGSGVRGIDRAGFGLDDYTISTAADPKWYEEIVHDRV